MKRCLPVLLLLLAAPGFAQEAGKAISHPFYPLKVGNQWTYRSGNERVVIRVDKEVLLKAPKDENVTGFLLRETSGPREVTEEVAVLADGVYRFRSAGKAIKPPLRFFKFPLEKGDSWKIDSKTEDGKVLRGTFVAGTDTVELTLGGKAQKVAAVTITCKDFQIGDERMSITYWFARDLGMVKQQVHSGKHDGTLELIDFKAGR